MILVFSPNSIQYALAIFGGQAAGLTVSTANSGYTPTELAHQIRDSQAAVILASSDLLPVALKALKEKDVKVKEDAVFVLPGIDGTVKVQEGARSWLELRGKKGFRPFRRTDEKEVQKFAACKLHPAPRLPDALLPDPFLTSVSWACH